MDNVAQKIHDANKAQQNVINAVLRGGGDVQNIAGAGAGKTKTIVELVVGGLSPGPVGPDGPAAPPLYTEDEILMLTFSRSGMLELKARFKKRNVGSDFVKTFDSLCQSGTGTSPLSIVDFEESRKEKNRPGLSDIVKAAMAKQAGLSTQAMIDWSKVFGCDGDDDDDDDGSEDGKIRKKIILAISRVTAAGHDLDSPEVAGVVQCSDVAAILKHVGDALKSMGDDTCGTCAINYRNLLRQQHGAFKYKLVIVDEAQDNNVVQQQIARILAKNGKLFTVGDPRQCVHRWRGAEPDIFLEFGMRETTTLTQLAHNFRSRPVIVAYANAIANSMATAEHTKAMVATREDVDDAGGVRFGVGFASSVHALKSLWAGNCPDVAVLVRNWAHMGELEELLWLNQIPYRLKSRAKTEAFKYIRKSGISSEDMAAVQAHYPHGLRKEEDRLWDLARTMSKAMARAQGIYRLAGVLKLAAKFYNFGSDREQRTFAAFESSSPYFAKGYTYAKATNTGATPPPAITISSIHGTKGEEYTAVFVLEWGLKPRLDDCPTPEEASARREDELRLYYTAVTRAKDLLVLVAPSSVETADLKVEPSRFYWKAANPG